jgi:hypothetical protein
LALLWISTVRISIELRPEDFNRINEIARLLDTTPEKLVHAILMHGLSEIGADFQIAAQYVLSKNKELYERLAK